MIRIQADKADLHAQPSVKTQRELPVAKNLIQLDQSDKETAPTGRNNTRLRGLSHGHRRIETAEVHTERAINSRATIDSPLSINGNIRSNYVGRKFGKRDDKLKVNFSDLHGKAIISEDLLGRPSSFQKKNEKEESFRSTSQRKKKSLPFRRSDGKRPGSLGTTIKYSGLELKGQKMEQALEADLFEKLHNETKIL